MYLHEWFIMRAKKVKTKNTKTNTLQTLQFTDKKEKMLKSLEATIFNISESCKSAGISRTTYYNWLKDDPEFEEAVKYLEEGQKDFVESKLLDLIKEGNATAIIFYLKTRAKDRGYTERHEIKDVNSPVNIEIVKTYDYSKMSTDELVLLSKMDIEESKIRKDRKF